MFTSLLIRRLAFAAAIPVLASLTSFAWGQNLVFNQTQMDAGKALYKDSCQICHGSTMVNGQFGTPLRGSFFQDKWKGKSVAELLSFVYEKMPPDKLMSLRPEQYTNAVAYILSRNDIVVSETAMSTSKETLNSTMLPW